MGGGQTPDERRVSAPGRRGLTGTHDALSGPRWRSGRGLQRVNMIIWQECLVTREHQLIGFGGGRWWGWGFQEVVGGGGGVHA